MKRKPHDPYHDTGRVQLALNVSDSTGRWLLSKLFDTDPAKRKPGYANFAIDAAPAQAGAHREREGGSINHLGVEVEDTDLVRQAGERFSVTGIGHRCRGTRWSAATPSRTRCGSTAPDGERWEYYTVLNDSEAMRSASTEAACCASAPVEAACC